MNNPAAAVRFDEVMTKKGSGDALKVKYDEHKGRVRLARKRRQRKRGILDNSPMRILSNSWAASGCYRLLPLAFPVRLA